MRYLIFAVFLLLFPLNNDAQHNQFRMDIVARQFFQFEPSFVANKIAYPVNHGSMKGYHDAKPFGTKNHLGADINGDGMGNTDFGDTVYSIGKGKVIYLYQANQEEDNFMSIIMILHKTKLGYIDSLYRHCRMPLIKLYDYVDYLQAISTIGNDFGLYQAHLHFEIRTNILLGIGYGSGDSKGYVDPMKFIEDFNK
jgi:hypothetical protein